MKYLVLVFALCSCAPMTLQELSDAVVDARIAYPCLQIAAECGKVAAGEVEPLEALRRVQTCQERFKRAGCEETLKQLEKYAPKPDGGPD